MKKLVIALLLGCAGLASADNYGSVNRSSFTQTNETGKYIQAAALDKIIIGAASAGGVLTLYNSTWTTNAPIISSMSLGTVGVRDFNNTLVSGLIYTTISNTAGVTIIYKR